jgi:cbb3-type cytochrome oxidase cytochrome c subunit
MRRRSRPRCASCARSAFPYSDEEIAGAKAQLEGKTELDVLIAYLQGMGLELKDAK